MRIFRISGYTSFLRFCKTHAEKVICRQSLSSSSHLLFVVCFSVMHSDKGWLVLIRAIYNMNKRYNSYSYMVWGVMAR